MASLTNQIVDLGCKGVNTNTVSLIFSDPDGGQTPPTSKRPVASIQYTGDGTLWRIIVSDVGYGYSATPTVSHGDILAYLPVLKTGFTTTDYGDSQNRNRTIVGGGTFSGVALNTVAAFSETATKINLGGLKIGFDPRTFFTRNHKWITGGYSLDNEFRYVFADYNGGAYSSDPRIALAQRTPAVVKGAELLNSI